MFISAEKLPEFLDNAEQKSLNDMTSLEMDLLKAHRPAQFKAITDTVDAPAVVDGEVPPVARREMRVSRNGAAIDNSGRRSFRNGFLVSDGEVKNPNSEV